MNAETLAAKIDHCALGPLTQPEDVRRIVDEVDEYGMNAVCVPRCYVTTAVEYGPNVPVMGGIGGGTATTESKAEDAKRAYREGAKEIDMVMNVSRLRAGHTRIVQRDIAAVVDAVPVAVKVIIETPLLDGEEEVRQASRAAKDAGADYLKNTTGFVGEQDDEEKAEHISVMSEYLPPKVSAVFSCEEVEMMIEAGAERIGTPEGPGIIEEYRTVHG